MPRDGGQYVYLSELYGPLWGFLYGWTLVLVIQTGTIAAVAVAFATYAGELWPALTPSQALFSLGRITVSPVQAVAAGVVLLLTALNARGLEAGRWVQNVFTVAKVGTLLAVIALGLGLGGGTARATNLARPAFATGLGPRETGCSWRPRRGSTTATSPGPRSGCRARGRRCWRSRGGTATFSTTSSWPSCSSTCSPWAGSSCSRGGAANARGGRATRGCSSRTSCWWPPWSWICWSRSRRTRGGASRWWRAGCRSMRCGQQPSEAASEAPAE